MSTRRTIALAAALASCLVACLDPGTVPCGERLCVSGTTCIAGELCATDEQLAACSGRTDGSSCSYGASLGHCDRGVCVPVGCGNHIVDNGEVCDDGNTADGDGCRGDCSKLEQCGDGMLDEGEACDDGNTSSVDDCDACVVKVWRAEAVVGGGVTATSIGLQEPRAIVVDPTGNIYFADSGNHRVRRLGPTGIITTIAGTGTRGFNGDGGPGTSAELALPSGLALDSFGNLYIADTANHRIRRVDRLGTISTVAGVGTPGLSGDYMLATTAQLNTPRGVAMTALGELLIADSGNDRIRRVDPATGVITTARISFLNNPQGLVLTDNTLYIADTSNHRVVKVAITISGGFGPVTTIAGGPGVPGFSGDGGAATSAKLSSPGEIALDGVGNLFVADANNHRIRRIDAMTGIITTVAGTATAGYNGDEVAATSAQLWLPQGIAVDPSGTLYIGDTNNHRVRKIDSSSVIHTAAGSGVAGFGDGVGTATCAQLGRPQGVAVDGAGNLYIADTLNRRIRRATPTGTLTTIAGTGTGSYGGDGGLATTAQLVGPQAVTIDDSGNLYIADTTNHRVRKVDAAGIISTVAGTGSAGYTGDNAAATAAQLSDPSGVAVDGSGNLYIADKSNHCIRRVGTNGVITTIAGTGAPGYTGDNAAASAAQLNDPTGIAIRGSLVYIADTSNHAIRQIDGDGVITTIAGIGTPGDTGDDGAATVALLNGPSGVAADSAGNLYIADALNYRIRRVNTDGVITTVAGTGTEGFLGDGAGATTAQIAPTSIAVDSAGNLFIADATSSTVRRVDETGIITTIAGHLDPEGMGLATSGHFTDPRALVVAPPFTLVAGGNTGTVQAVRDGVLEVVTGRYPQSAATGALARFRDAGFGSVSGIAYDHASTTLYLTESSSNRIDVVTVVDLADQNSWTIAALANAAGTAGFVNGDAQAARFRAPRGLHLVPGQQLYVVDTGNHVVRRIDLSSGIANATVTTVAGTPTERGWQGDGGPATAALLSSPNAITRCPNGDLFVADTGNHRVRRIAAATGVISTVLGTGGVASSGEGSPASGFPVNTPRGLACDPSGNLFVSSTTTVRMLPADASGVVDGAGVVRTIYGGPPRDSFPANVTSCLTGVAVVDASTIQVADSCTGLVVELRHEPP